HWYDPHTNPTWRQVTPNGKREKGQMDVRDPVVRAAICASCHIGNLDEGKFVTHEMYAAGHPPLPPLEVMSFSRDQKAHYKLARELPYLKDLAEKDIANNTDNAWKLFHFRGYKIESQPARQVAVGAIVSLKAQMDLLIGPAGQESTSKNGLDFAHFNCAACHH